LKLSALARTFPLLALGIALLLPLPEPASAQESLGFRLPDSIRVMHDPFFLPSLSFTPSQLLGNQSSLDCQTIIGNPGLLSAHNAAWKRSFLIGAAVMKPKASQPYSWHRKGTFFQGFQEVLGYAVFAGAGYAAYRAIRNEPITKKKK